MSKIQKILVTGATGYVGGRLTGRLLEKGHTVRVLARDPSRLQGRPWSHQVEIVQGDVLKPETLAAAMQHIDAAYYLIHSLRAAGRAGGDFRQRDLMAARAFGQAAAAAGVKRLIYLGGLGDHQAELSRHLRSRQETGEALRESGVPVTELRAAVIVGSGSASFELVRHLTERMPVILCPPVVHTRIQPIGMRNVLEYLEAALEEPAAAGRVIEIGGADVLTYGDMMLGYARERGLKRHLLPILPHRLASYWITWVTPIPPEIARPLVEGLRNEVVVRDNAARHLFPQVQPVGYQTAVQRALERLDAGFVETAWSDALVTTQGDVAPVKFSGREGMMFERRQRIVAASPAAVFRAFTAIGGEQGWPSFNWAWQARGVLDWLVGGVGFRRGRRSPDDLRVGDALDFWRVEAVEPDRLLRLRAEMKVPGRAWLQFEARPRGSGRTLLIQTAFFAPKGVPGLLYWYSLYPIHGPIFNSTIERLSKAAEAHHHQAQSP
ncbi:MAG: SDR family oxidoreductase [Caldilineales bacterium]